MKKCPNCGTEWQDKDIFCGECGSSLIEEEIKSELQTDSLNKSFNEEKSVSSSNSSSKYQKTIEEVVPINLDIKKVESGLSEPDIKIQENLIVCKKCGKELPDGAAFCMYCGTPVIVDVVPEVTVENNCSFPESKTNSVSLEKVVKKEDPKEDFNWKLIECPSCHKEISRFATSCPNCGHPFPENTPKPESTSSNASSNNSNDSGGTGFWGIVMAVIVAIILISLF